MKIPKPDRPTKILGFFVYCLAAVLLVFGGTLSPNIWRKVDFISGPMILFPAIFLVWVALSIFKNRKVKYSWLIPLIILPWGIGVMYFFCVYDVEYEKSKSIELTLPEIDINVDPDKSQFYEYL